MEEIMLAVIRGKPGAVAELIHESPEFRELVAGLASAGQASQLGEGPAGVGNGNGLSPKIKTFLGKRMSANALMRGRVEQLLTATGKFGPDMEQEPGDSTKSHDGFTRYVWGRREGAKAIFYTYSSGKVELRLPADVAEHYGPHVEGVPNRTDGYQIRVRLSDDKAVADAIELAKMAYDKALDDK